jgi:NAD(P)-dependent dehydrogenase (short-subunit alcohol dehydrogenase family)
MLTSLKGAWCLVLGVSSGIGRACALGLARNGANIIGLHFDTAARAGEVRELVGQLAESGVRAQLFNVNAGRKSTRDDLLPKIGELTDGAGVRVLLHSIAFGTLVPYLPREGATVGLAQRQLEMTLDVMANSLVYWVQDLVRADLLSRGAKVFAMTSAGTSRLLPSYGAVSAAKSALEAHVRQLACELAPRGVAVNALRAGTTLTPALRAIPGHDRFVADGGALNPHGRLTVPEDVAEAVVLLSQSDSSWITGNTIGVDGGEILAAGTSWAPATTG